MIYVLQRNEINLNFIKKINPRAYKSKEKSETAVKLYLNTVKCLTINVKTLLFWNSAIKIEQYTSIFQDLSFVL